MKKYLLHNNGSHMGPYTAEELRLMHITPSTPVWHEGLEGWKNAGEIPELKNLFVADVQQPSSFQQPLQNSAAAHPYYYQNNNHVTAKTQNNSATKIVLIVVGIFVLIAGTIGFVVYLQVKQVKKNMEEAMRSIDSAQDFSPSNYNYDTSGIVIKEPIVSDPNAQQLFKETMPEFPGGPGAFNKFIINTIRYPMYAKENGIQGTVYVRFTIDKQGNVVNPKIARSVHPVLDKEAMRMVNKMPKWKPGTMNGSPVKIEMTQPIKFKLQ